MTISLDYFPAVGGLNQEAPPLAMQPGELVDGANYECLPNGGYRRIYGYELFDGQDSGQQPVPGTGDILGVLIYKGNVYAFRGNGSVVRMYRATNSGWVQPNSGKTWSLSGKFRCCNYNFMGQDYQEKMFIVNGVNRAEQFDGVNFTTLYTGAGTDNPSLVVGYKYHLFLAVESSLVSSGIGEPTSYSVSDGAIEIAVGDTITNLREHSSALIVGCQDSTKTLYGSSLADWQLEDLNKAGSYEDTLESIGGQVMGLDRQGLMSLSAAQQFGNFAYASLSQKVATLIQQFTNQFGVDPVSVINRSSNQYRLFNDRDGLYFTFAGPQLVGVAKTRFPDPVKCISSAIDEQQSEVTVFGSEDGKVFKMDTGYRFNEQPIYAYLLTNFTAYGGSTVNKRFRLVQPDIRVEGLEQVRVAVRATTEYGLGDSSRGVSLDLYPAPGSLYDVSFWDEFKWDATYSNDAKVRVSVSGTNMGVYIATEGTENAVHTVHGVTLHYSPRRLKR